MARSRIITEVPEYHLWRHVLGAPAEGMSPVLLTHVGLREPKIGDLYVPVVADQQVLGLEVTVDDLVLVQVEQPIHDLNKVEPSMFLGHALDLLEVVEKFTSGAV